ncbi:MAG: SH3 domain-containing protein [Brevinematales bacterium]|nr:SH3 domain-containing protein [Brevinematales bacterium]
MKKVLLSLFFLSVSSYLFGEAPVWYAPGDKLTVLAPSGLNLREKADINGKLVIKVPYGGKLTVLKDAAKPVVFSFDNIDGHWVYADYAGKKGYIFDGYLSTLPAPEVSEDSQYPLLDYLYSVSESSGDPEQDGEGGEGSMTSIEKYSFDNKCTAEISVTDYWTDDPDYIREVYTFPMMTRVEDAFILLKAFGYFSGDPKFVFPTQSISPKENKLKFEIQKSANVLTMYNDDIFIQITADKNGVTLDIRNQ